MSGPRLLALITLAVLMMCGAIVAALGPGPEAAHAVAVPEHTMLASRDAEPPPDAPPDVPRTLGEAGIDMIRSALAAADGNISVASKRLGISRNTIYRKLRWNKGD